MKQSFARDLKPNEDPTISIAILDINATGLNEDTFLISAGVFIFLVRCHLQPLKISCKWVSRARTL